MSKNDGSRETYGCVVGRFLAELEQAFDDQSEFLQHFNRSRIEFLKALRSLVDRRIERLEKRSRPKGKKRMSKIEVE
ncbi:MAG: hypothetical protein JSW39_10205 [Desulfobacterales bacterium]|nr:MAG: hypothetical protein JSW39_10205 [Desulfobacterales bacterium]